MSQQLRNVREEQRIECEVCEKFLGYFQWFEDIVGDKCKECGRSEEEIGQTLQIICEECRGLQK